MLVGYRWGPWPCRCMLTRFAGGCWDKWTSGAGGGSTRILTFTAPKPLQVPGCKTVSYELKPGGWVPPMKASSSQKTKKLGVKS